MVSQAPHIAPRYFNEHEVAAITNLSLKTLRRWRMLGRGPAYKKFGAAVRYAESTLTAWIDAQPTGGDRRVA